MNSPFDILKKPDGSFRWFEAVNDLESANIRIKELIALSPVAGSGHAHAQLPADTDAHAEVGHEGAARNDRLGPRGPSRKLEGLLLRCLWLSYGRCAVEQLGV